jgi:hypothetical protein
VIAAMPAMGNMLEKADKALMHVFTRLAHAVDHRFHINPYVLARDVMGVGVALFGAQTVQDVMLNWKHHMPVVFSVMLAFLLMGSFFSIDLVRLTRAGDAYEKHPHRVSRDAAHYVLLPHALRLMLLGFGAEVAAVLTGVDLTTRHAALPYYIENFWLMLAGCSWYIAGVKPPHRGRRKKKERAPAAAALQGA